MYVLYCVSFACVRRPSQECKEPDKIIIGKLGQGSVEKRRKAQAQRRGYDMKAAQQLPGVDGQQESLRPTTPCVTRQCRRGTCQCQCRALQSLEIVAACVAQAFAAPAPLKLGSLGLFSYSWQSLPSSGTVLYWHLSVYMNPSRSNI